VTAVLLDTNVLLRLVERSAPEHNVVLTAIEKLAGRGSKLVLAPAASNGFGWGVGHGTKPPSGIAVVVRY
jgi:predicted nucleic acid-binding protein